MARKGRRTSWPLHRDSRLGRSSGLGPLYFRTREFLSVRYEEHGLEVKEYNVYACFDMLPWLEVKGFARTLLRRSWVLRILERQSAHNSGCFKRALCV